MIENIKKYVIYAVLPISLVLGFIYYLLQKVSGLQSIIYRQKAEGQIAETLTKLNEAKKDADISEQDYLDALNKYNKRDT